MPLDIDGAGRSQHSHRDASTHAQLRRRGFAGSCTFRKVLDSRCKKLQALEKFSLLTKMDLSEFRS